MSIEDPARARRILERVNYYRLSGYWYSFHELGSDGTSRSGCFVKGTELSDVVALYDVDERLRIAVFAFADRASVPVDAWTRAWTH